MRIPVDILVIVCLAVGILPMFTVAPILAVAVADTLQTTPPEYSLAVWHGFNIPLLMSFLALGLGVLIYFKRHLFRTFYDRYLDRLDGKKPLIIY